MSDDLVQAELIADRLLVNKLIMRLQQENAALKAKLAQRDGLLQRVRPVLFDEWESNHAEHCSNNWPHEGTCNWKQPAVLHEMNEVEQ